MSDAAGARSSIIEAMAQRLPSIQRTTETAVAVNRHPGSGRHWLLGAAIILLATVVAYWPAINAGFIWDDDDYLTANPNLHNIDGLIRLWQPRTTKQYYPVVFTTFWIEHQLWGLHPRGYHVLNIMLHALNAVVVWRLAHMLKIPGAWMIGAVFALHPVHVESVAWITERKNALSGLFYLSSMQTYLRFEDSKFPISNEREAGANSKWLLYSGSLTLFVLALLSKTVTCSLPAALILILLWRRQPVTLNRIALLLPFFAVGLALALHTAYLERVNVGAIGPEFDFSIADRMIIASTALLFYPLKLIAPWPLIFIYPRWEIDESNWLRWLPLLINFVIAGAGMMLWRFGRRGPLLAWLLYAGTIFPALGFFNVYPMRFSFVADHFQYLASLGMIVLVVGSLAVLLTNQRLRNALAALLLVSFAALTWSQCWAYQNEETLWRWTIDQNPRAWIAHNNLGKILQERGDIDGALERFQQAHDLHPADDQLSLNLAGALRTAERFDEALAHYRALHDLNKPNPLYVMKIAQTLDDLGRYAEAEPYHRLAVSAEAPEAGAPMLYARHLLKRDRAPEAVLLIKAFVAAHPEDAVARLALADAWAHTGQFEQAIAQAEHALSLARAQNEAQLARQIEARIAIFRAGQAPDR